MDGKIGLRKSRDTTGCGPRWILRFLGNTLMVLKVCLIDDLLLRELLMEV